MLSDSRGADSEARHLPVHEVFTYTYILLNHLDVGPSLALPILCELLAFHSMTKAQESKPLVKLRKAGGVMLNVSVY